MKRIFFLVAFMIVISAAFDNCSSRSTNNKHISKTKEDVLPKTKGELKCETAIIDIGSVSRDTIFEVNFPLNNIGEEKLKIIEYSVSCNCTSASVRDSTVSPGNATIFNMKINTKGKHLGEHQTDAVLKTNGKRTFCKLTAKYTTH